MKLSDTELKAMQGRAWQSWAQNVTAFLNDEQEIDAKITYDDLVLAAAEKPPGNLFQRNLRQVSIAQWSRLAALGSTAYFGGMGDVPGWLLFAGLRALHFGKDVLGKVKEGVGAPPRSEDNETIKALLDDAGLNVPPGYMLIKLDQRSDQRSVAEDPNYSYSVPLLALTEEEIFTYDRLITVLRSAGAFRGVTVERHPNEIEAG